MAAKFAMSVPGTELGLGADLESDTEEERKKRLLEARQNKLLPGASPMAKALGLLPGGMALNSLAGRVGRAGGY